MKPKHVAWLILLALVIGACGRSAIEPITSSILIVTPVSAGDTIPPMEDLVVMGQNGVFTRVVDRKAGAVCWIMRDRTYSSDGGVGVSVSCLPIKGLNEAAIWGNEGR